MVSQAQTDQHHNSNDVISLPGRRFDRYHELGQYAFGEKLGLYIVVPQQLIVEVEVEVGVNIVFTVTGGKSFIMIFASVHFVLSHLPNFNSISWVSLVAAIMSSCLMFLFGFLLA